MSMNLYVYVGPFLECHWADVDQEKIESVLTDGRMESRKQGENLFLIPNVKLEGVDRFTTFDKYGGEYPVVTIDAELVAEADAFHRLAREVIADLNDANAFYRIGWGVVPGVY